MARFEVAGVSLELEVPPSVYQPSDDTRLLVRAALEKIKGHAGRAAQVLEIGTGSGAVSLCLAKTRGKECQIVACDISPDAIETAKSNAVKNKLEVKMVRSDLFFSLPASARYDWIIFNPPYLPTAKLDKVRGALNVALDGGADGLAVVKTFVEEAGAHLAPGGHVLLVVSSLQPQQKLQTLLRRHGFTGQILSEESFFFEKLQVWIVHKAGNADER